MFSMLLAARLMEFKHELDNDHWRFFLTGGISLDDHLPPIPESATWLSAKSWAEIVRLSSLHKFDDFYKYFYTPDILVSDALSDDWSLKVFVLLERVQGDLRQQ